MESGHGEKRQLFAREFFDSLAHFFCRFVREGEGKNRALGHARVEHVGDSEGNHARFSAPRAGNNENRAVNRHDGFVLLRVQLVF